MLNPFKQKPQLSPHVTAGSYAAAHDALTEVHMIGSGKILVAGETSKAFLDELDASVAKAKTFTNEALSTILDAYRNVLVEFTRQDATREQVERAEVKFMHGFYRAFRHRPRA